MDVPLDEVIHFDFITSHPTTGAVSDADSTPSWATYEEATDTAIVSGNFTKRTSLTGDYRGTFACSTANGFEPGKWYSVIGSATISTVATKREVRYFRIIQSETLAGVSNVNTTLVDGNAINYTLDPDTDSVIFNVTGNAGSGAYTIAITVNDGATALQTARVRYTEGANTFIALTNASGVATFNLNAATYTVGITKDGYTYAGTTHVVSATAARTYSMTANTVTPPALPSQSTGVLTTLDGQGNPATAVVVSFKMTAGPGTAGSAYGQEFTLTSSGTSTGNLSGAFVKGATYQGWRGPQGKRYTFTVSATAGTSFTLPEILGLDPVAE
jgi:hypothetical protein